MDNEGAQIGLLWEASETGAACDLSGHFWATVRRTAASNTRVWNWMIIGYENQVLAAGQTGELSAAKRLVEAWDRWVCSDEATIDRTDNPVAIHEDCETFSPTWPTS